MSRGISWRQKSLLYSILKPEVEAEAHRQHLAAKYPDKTFERKPPRPVPWRAMDFGPGHEEGFGTPEWAWNREQATRRALRSLERRGLVELGSYSVGGDATDGLYVRPDHRDHIPGEDRWMVCALLTDAGREIAIAEWQEIHGDKAAE